MQTALNVCASLMALESISGDDIRLYINSQGTQMHCHATLYGGPHPVPFGRMLSITAMMLSCICMFFGGCLPLNTASFQASFRAWISAQSFSTSLPAVQDAGFWQMLTVSRV